MSETSPIFNLEIILKISLDKVFEVIQPILPLLVEDEDALY